MARHHGSAAYDFSRFEVQNEAAAIPQTPDEIGRPEKDNVIAMPAEQTKKYAKSRKRARLLRVTSVCGGLGVMFIISSILIFNQVRLTELTEQINTQSSALRESQSLYTQLQARSMSEFTLADIEEYATTRLNMQQTAHNQYNFIELSSGDKAEVVQNASPNWFFSVWNAIVNLLS